MHRPCRQNDSEVVSLFNDVGVTGSRDMLYSIAEGDGPEDSLVLFGFCCWDGGQLETELSDNKWLLCPADQEIIFRSPMDRNRRWHQAMDKIGINPANLYGSSAFC